MIMVELEALGAASASDKELLDRMGWTRERAAQVLGQLEDKGLVVSSSERQARGRPRKYFAGRSADRLMTRQQLLAIVARDALRPRMQFAELGGDHVPFDLISGHHAYESVVVRELSRDEAVRVSVAGPRGAGKTSLIAHCCQQLPQQVIALRVPVVAMDDPGDPAVLADVAIASNLAAGNFDVHQRQALEQARSAQVTTSRRDPSRRAPIGGGVIRLSSKANSCSGRSSSRAPRHSIAYGAWIASSACTCTGIFGPSS